MENMSLIISFVSIQPHFFLPHEARWEKSAAK